jgi:hypothetical protein
MNYTIDEAFTVRVFTEGNDVPFLLQPTYPNQDKFDSHEEAEVWAKLFIASYSDEEPYAPNGKGLEGKPKPTAEEIEAREARKNRTADSV